MVLCVMRLFAIDFKPQQLIILFSPTGTRKPLKYVGKYIHTVLEILVFYGIVNNGTVPAANQIL